MSSVMVSLSKKLKRRHCTCRLIATPCLLRESSPSLLGTVSFPVAPLPTPCSLVPTARLLLVCDGFSASWLLRWKASRRFWKTNPQAPGRSFSVTPPVQQLNHTSAGSATNMTAESGDRNAGEVPVQPADAKDAVYAMLGRFV